MVLLISLGVYVAAMVMANLLVLRFGPAVTPINSFFLIGLDLALRDFMHVRMRPWQMALTIAFAGGLAWILNPAAQFIAVASAASFCAAALVDWAVFSRASGKWLARSMKSNVAGAAVDSVLFPLIAFGAVLPWIVLGQFLAKVAGGALWALLLSKIMQSRRVEGASHG